MAGVLEEARGAGAGLRGEEGRVDEAEKPCIELVKGDEGVEVDVDAEAASLARRKGPNSASIPLKTASSALIASSNDIFGFPFVDPLACFDEGAGSEGAGAEVGGLPASSIWSSSSATRSSWL